MGVAAVVAVAVAIGLILAKEDKCSPLNDALGYLPEDSPLAVAVSTDLEGESFEDLDAALQRFGVEGGIEGNLDELGEDGFPADAVRDMLGNDLVIGVPSGASVSEGEADRFVAALRVQDGEDVRDMLEGFGATEEDEVEGATVYGFGGGEDGEFEAPSLAIDDDTVIAATSLATLESALRTRAGDDALTEDTFEERLGDLPSDGLVRATGDVSGAIETIGIEQLESVPWIDSLQTFGLSLAVDGRELTVDAALEGEEVSEEELPLVPGPESPQVVAGEASFATLDQSQTLGVVLDSLKAALPQATLDAGIKRFETKLNGSVPALIDQFGEGQIAEIDRGRGEDPESVSRSEVRDPAAVAQALVALKDEVPRLAQLSGVGSYGDALEAAKILIPALPVPEEDFLFTERATVEAVPGQPDLYRMVSPGPAAALPGRQFYFGLMNDVFVTAPSLEAAQAAAELELIDHQGPPGSVVGSLLLRPSALDLPAPEGVDTVVTTVQIGLETSTTGLTLRLEASL